MSNSSSPIWLGKFVQTGTGHNKGDLLRIMHGEDIGTLVTADATEES